jgi:hypothetical protein
VSGDGGTMGLSRKNKVNGEMSKMYVLELTGFKNECETIDFLDDVYSKMKLEKHQGVAILKLSRENEKYIKSTIGFSENGDEEMFNEYDYEVKTGELIFNEINDLKKEINMYEKSLDRLQSFSGDEEEFDVGIKLLKNEKQKVEDKLRDLMNMKYTIDKE